MRPTPRGRGIDVHNPTKTSRRVTKKREEVKDRRFVMRFTAVRRISIAFVSNLFGDILLFAQVLNKYPY